MASLTKPEKYARDVLREKIKACKWVKLACQRHYDDLKNADDRGLFFDSDHGLHMIKFIELILKHSKGEFSGSAFILEPWQAFLVWQVFGWKKSNGSRRFRYAFLEVARKNGKTTFLAALCIVCSVVDGEATSEAYFAATKRDQARIAFDETGRMIRSSEDLNALCTVQRNNISIESTFSKIEPLSSDRDSLDGLNPHFTGVDEYHAHKDPLIYNVLKSASGARRQPLQVTITTAGFNKEGPCHRLEKTCKQILEGKLSDDSMFCIIYQLDEGDSWTNSRNWIKANPNLNTSIALDYLKQEFVQAKNYGGTEEVNFKTKHLNLWVDAAKTWIQDEIWQASAGLEGSFDGPAFGGLDLASISDFTALALTFPQPDGSIKNKYFFWLPEQSAKRRSQDRHDDNYLDWIDQGFIKMTPGNVTDYDQILRDITGRHIVDGVVEYDEECIMTRYDLKSIAYDRFNSSQLVINLTGEGVVMSPFGQGFVSMSAPTKELNRLVLEKKYHHFKNPVMRWMASNVAVKQDPAGNIKLDKDKSGDKIDGMIAAVMALGESMTHQPETKTIAPGMSLLISG